MAGLGLEWGGWQYNAQLKKRCCALSPLSLTTDSDICRTCELALALALAPHCRVALSLASFTDRCSDSSQNDASAFYAPSPSGLDGRTWGAGSAAAISSYDAISSAYQHTTISVLLSAPSYAHLSTGVAIIMR
eukprot:886992-Rhodomonas_salina.1